MDKFQKLMYYIIAKNDGALHRDAISRMMPYSRCSVESIGGRCTTCYSQFKCAPTIYKFHYGPMFLLATFPYL